MKMIRLFIRKVICLVLSFVLLITGSPVSFAQEIAKEIQYMPAISFNYEFFTLGKTNESVFIEKLKADMDDNQDEDSFEPIDMQNNIIKDADPLNNRFMQYKPIAKAYNDFMYYNAYPEQSPYWKWTALVPDEETSEDDVLLILLKHKQLTDEILKLFGENEEYKKLKEERVGMFVFGTLVLALESWLLWELVPILRMPKWLSMPILLGLDIWINDKIAFSLRNLGDMKEGMDEIDIQIATFDNMKKRNMFKSQVESNKIGICKTAEENAKNLKEAYIATNGNYKIGQEMAKWERISAFCKENKPIFGYKDARLEIGEYLNEEYKKLSYSKERINYMRKEMLHIYYALLFIKEELKDKSDKLRFDRALIDIATTYKIAYVTFTDGRIVSWNKPPEFVSQLDMFMDKGLHKEDFMTEVVTEEGEVVEGYTVLGGDFVEKVMPYRSYPSLLNRAQLNYIVQKVDIQRQKNKRIKQIRDEQRKSNPIVTTIDKKFIEMEAKDYFYKFETVH